MAHQHPLFPQNPERSPKPGQDGSEAGPGPARSFHWMARLETVIRIVVRLYLGLLVFALPWLAFWTQNNLFTYSPVLHALATNGFVRGVFSGLGLLNVILALMEAKAAPELR